MNCATIPKQFQGRSGVDSIIDKIDAVTLAEKGNTFTKTNIITLPSWKTLISGVAGGMKAITLKFSRGYENTTEDLPVETSNTGYKEPTDEPLPSMTGYLSGSFCDYQTLIGLFGESYDVFLHLKNGSIYATQNSSLNIAGFRARVFTRKNIPLVDTRLNSYPLYIMFDDISQFNYSKQYKVQPNFTLTDLFDVVPVGLGFDQLSAYASGVVTTKVFKRSDGSGLAGLTADDYYIIDTNAPDVDVTSIVDKTTGEYDLTIKKNAGTTPIDLVAGEYAWVQARNDDGTNYTYASNLFKISA